MTNFDLPPPTKQLPYLLNCCMMPISSDIKIGSDHINQLRTVRIPMNLSKSQLPHHQLKYHLETSITPTFIYVFMGITFVYVLMSRMSLYFALNAYLLEVSYTLISVFE